MRILRTMMSGRFALIYIAVALLCTLFIAHGEFKEAEQWVTGDWLTNYSGGFLRRGLMGEVLLQSARAFKISPATLAQWLPLLVYVPLYLILARLYVERKNSFWLMVLLVSPATIANPVFGLLSGLHKEILYFLLLAAVALWLRRGTWTSSLAVSVCLAFILLTHEGLAPYLVYLAAALAMLIPDRKRLFAFSILPILAVLLTEVASVRYIGSPHAAQAICDSLGPENTRFCVGSVSYLAKTRQEARADVALHIHRWHYERYYPFLAVLALIPIIGLLGSLRTSSPRDSRIISVAIAVAWLVTLPLFAIGLDWGRWIQIHIMCAFILLLLANRRSNNRYTLPRVVERHPAWTLTVLLIYMTCWNLTPGGNNVKKGYLNRLHNAKPALKSLRSHL